MIAHKLIKSVGVGAAYQLSIATADNLDYLTRIAATVNALLCAQMKS